MRSFSPFACRVLSSANRGNLRQGLLATPHQRTDSDSRRVPATTTIGRFLRPSPHLCCPLLNRFSSRHFSETSPLRNDTGFWRYVARHDQTRRHHGFLLQTVTSFHRPRLTHYYGIIRHLTPREPVLESPLEPTLPNTPTTNVIRRPDDARLPQLLCCFLSKRLPAGDCILNHGQSLFMNRASRYFARSPRQAAESGSLSLCTTSFLWLPSDSAVASDALAIRILFPMNRARSLKNTDWVCQLRWANKKSPEVRDDFGAVEAIGKQS